MRIIHLRSRNEANNKLKEKKIDWREKMEEDQKCNWIVVVHLLNTIHIHTLWFKWSISLVAILIASTTFSLNIYFNTLLNDQFTWKWFCYSVAHYLIMSTMFLVATFSYIINPYTVKPPNNEIWWHSFFLFVHYWEFYL